MAIASSLIGVPPLRIPPPEEVAKASWVEVVEDRLELVKHQSAWETLARSAIEPNVFYEPWMFVPAAEVFDIDKRLCCVFVYRHAPGSPEPMLCGFLPMVRTRRFKGLPIRTLQTWQHAYAVLGTPLVHRDHVHETLRALLDWFTNVDRCSVIELSMIHGEGPFHQALIDVLNERRVLSFVNESFTRALIRRGSSAENYRNSATNGENRSKWRRQRRRLAETGKLETRVLQPDGDVEPWIEQFLQLEASGWKGRGETALAFKDADRAYFRAIALTGFANGQLQMLGLFLDDMPIALKCNYLSGAGGFAFKIAYDETYAKFSPGLLLELDNIDEMHRRPGLEWLDSCAVPDHEMINRLWKERRTLQSITLATSRWVGNGVVGLLPMLRAARRMMR
jgi:CelD/BcsL family acetyltransferase involved in cellulose biosynthesis